MKKSSLIFIFLFLACVNHEFPIYVDCDAFPLSFQIKSIVPATDCDATDGSVTFQAKGGKKPYAFSLDGVTWGSDSNFLNIPSRAYSFYFKDANGCTLQIDSTLTRAGEFPGTITTAPDTECVENTGSIHVALDNPEGFMYRLDNGDFSDAFQFNGIREGEHTLYIRNSNGCTTITSVDVPRVSTGVSWVNDILPIMTASCATSGCHDGISRRDWRNYNEVKLYAAAIKLRTRNRSMPFDKTLPQDQIDKISCWVDDGALNN